MGGNSINIKMEKVIKKREKEKEKKKKGNEEE